VKYRPPQQGHSAETAATITRLKHRIKRLEEWKESALAVEREWDANAIAKLLGAKLGESQRKVIQREVPLLLERIKRLEKSSQQLKSLNNKICEINLKVSQERHDSNVHIKRLEAAGDEMHRYIFDQTNTRWIICAIQWREAKEAKP
jgi:hypothetical protein